MKKKSTRKRRKMRKISLIPKMKKMKLKAKVKLCTIFTEKMFSVFPFCLEHF